MVQFILLSLLGYTSWKIFLQDFKRRLVEVSVFLLNILLLLVYAIYRHVIFINSLNILWFVFVFTLGVWAIYENKAAWADFLYLGLIAFLFPLKTVLLIVLCAAVLGIIEIKVLKKRDSGFLGLLSVCTFFAIIFTML